jgi:hypothetical protein
MADNIDVADSSTIVVRWLHPFPIPMAGHMDQCLKYTLSFTVVLTLLKAQQSKHFN